MNNNVDSMTPAYTSARKRQATISQDKDHKTNLSIQETSNIPSPSVSQPVWIRLYLFK